MIMSTTPYQTYCETMTQKMSNVDETGLPKRTLQFKGEPFHGGKNNKERLSVAITANMTGTEKLKPLVIGKLT